MKWRILLVYVIEKIKRVFENRFERLQKIGVKEGMRFLDVGCGFGFYSFPASLLVGENGLVYALDVNPDRLEWIANRAKRMQRDNIKTIMASARNTRLPSDDIDIVFLHLVLHDLNDKPSALKEFYRVLKTGGKLVIDEKDTMTLGEVRRLAEASAFELSIVLYKTVQIFEKSSLPSKRAR